MPTVDHALFCAVHDVLQSASALARGRRTDDDAVGVQKAIDLIGTGDSIQGAVTEALDRARLSLEGITSFEVQRISGVVGGFAAAGRCLRVVCHRRRAAGGQRAARWG
ncbi:MAG TPA: dodecin domain-containing protein [Blastococcus sp.]